MPPDSLRLPLATGLTYHALEWGADDPSLDHTVVLVHGFLDLSWGWAETVEAGLAGRFHLLAPDMRGHGDSDRVGPGGYYYFLDYVADLRSLIAERGRSKVSLVGHSMGGMICSYYAGTFPEQLERLALLEGMGPPERNVAGPDQVRAWIAGWERARSRLPRAYADLDAAAARLRKNDNLLSHELSLALARHGTRKTDDGQFVFKHDPVHLTRGPTPYRVDHAEAFWQRITCPVLLIDGSETTFRYSEEDERRRLSALGNPPSVRLEGAGHMMQRHAPQELAEHLAAFLAD